MSGLRATLIGDGGTERALLHVLQWVLGPLVPEGADVVHADLRTLSAPPRTLADRSRTAMRLYPADLLFVHRDAEAASLDERRAEIAEAVADEVDVHVPVVPVRMTEAWLLSDEPAIRRAAGNPNGRGALDLPRLTELDRLPDPQSVLHGALLAAAELPAHRRRRFGVRQAVHHVAMWTESFAALRALAAFAVLERDTAEAIARWRAVAG